MTTLPTPKKVFADGEELKVTSETSDTVYTLKRVDDHYSCTCPAWRIKKGVTVDARTCKHLRSVLGDAFENARLASKGQSATGSTSAKSKPPAKRAASSSSSAPAVRKGKKLKKDDEEEDGEEVSDKDAVGSTKKEVAVLLANKFDLEGKKDPQGYWISEKLDGIRAYWDGQNQLYSRLGNPFHAPAWFIRKLPKGHTLDGELFHSRNNFSAATSIVRSHNSEKWNEIRFKVFDIPSLAHLPFEERVAKLKKLFPTAPTIAPSASTSSSMILPQDPAPGKSNYQWVTGPIVELVEHVQCKGKAHLVKMLKEIEENGGEGLMLREPKSLYIPKRSSTLLKVKTFFDAEARVMGYEPGKGKYKGMTGSLLCEMGSGKTFSCGSGLTDAQRQQPPKIGAIINYRFQEVTKDAVPRFPTFIGERVDVTAPKDADVSRKVAKLKAGADDA